MLQEFRNGDLNSHESLRVHEIVLWYYICMSLCLLSNLLFSYAMRYTKSITIDVIKVKKRLFFIQSNYKRSAPIVFESKTFRVQSFIIDDSNYSLLCKFYYFCKDLVSVHVR